jgi:hypothetical protein
MELQERDAKQPSVDKTNSGMSTARAFIGRWIARIGAIVALLLGAGVLTIQWEHHQRDAELKAALVKDISTSLARTSMSARFVATGSYGIEEAKKEARPGRIQQRYNQGQQRWEEDAARIRAQMEAYYKNPKITEEWKRFSSSVSKYYQLSRSLPPEGTDQRKRNLTSRRKWADEIREYLNGNPSVSWDGLINRTGGDKYANDYIILGGALLERQADISKRVLEARTVYTTRLNWLYSWL